MSAPLVYVIIINWNGREHLDACFRSLIASPYPNARFLLVDNASDDGSVSHVEEHFGQDPRVAILALEKNYGWSGGNNAGIRLALEASADFILLLNNDTAVAPNALTALVEAMERDSQIGALAPRMVLFDQPDIINSVGLRVSSIGAAWDIGIGRFDGPAWQRVESVAGVCGGACFLRATVLEQTGLLPEDFEIYLDDLDLCLRIWNADYSIRSCPESLVLHKFSATMGSGTGARRKYYLNTRNRFRILLRHFPRRSMGYVLPRVIVGEMRAMGRGILSGQWWRPIAHIQAWFDSLAYLPAALRFRRAHMPAGVPAYWSLIARSPLFCPHVELPERGWYPPIVQAGERYRPMARRATLKVEAGPLQVRLANCYPPSGEANVTLYMGGTAMARLQTLTSTEQTLHTPGGEITIVADSQFLMEDTGATADAGAWIQILAGGVPLL